MRWSLRPWCFLVVGSVLSASCATRTWSKQDGIARTSRLRVETERYSREGPSPVEYAHPATVSAGDLEAFFMQLGHRSSSDSSREPAVHGDLAAPLAEGVRLGLAACDATSRVRFVVLNPKRVLGLLPGSSITRGVAFVDDGALHVAFDLVDELPEDESFGSWGNPVSRSITRGQLVLPEGAALHQEMEEGDDGELVEGETRRLWIEMPLTALAALSDRESATGVAATGEGTTPIDATTGVVPPAEGGVREGGGDEEATDLTLDDDTKRIRLDYLNGLHREGWISDQAYRELRARFDAP